MIPDTTVPDFDAAVAWLVGELRGAGLGPFDRPVVLAEHPAQWRAVTLGVARFEGCAASLRVVTPDGWVEEAFGLLGARQQWRARELRWRILDAFRDDTATLPPGFNDAADVVSRLEHATAVARRFREYLRHRPEMLLHWESAGTDFTARPDLEGWQRTLWRHLVAADGGWSPAQRLAAARRGEVALEAAQVPVFALAPATLGPTLHDLLDVARGQRPLKWCALAPDVTRLPETVSLHACHSPLREMETCRELVAQALAADAALRPEHITLYVTDLATYLPVVDAVFGVDEPGLPSVPYSVAGRPHGDASDVPSAFLALLAAAQGRASADEIVALLERAPLARAAGIEATELAGVDRLVRAAGITWGESGADRAARFDLPALDTGTWAQGLDRLTLGIATGDTVVPVDGILPVAGATTGTLSLVDRLITWTDALFAAFATLREARTAVDWREVLERLLQDFVLATDATDAEGLRLLRQSLTEQLDGVAAAAPQAQLPLDGLRALLNSALGRHDRRSGHLRGGMRVCTLEPGAVLPAQVVLIAGLDDERHPRSGGSLAWDLLTHGEKRLTDPDARLASLRVAEEAVASAAQRAHLLWTGFSQAKHEERAASVVVARIEERLRQRAGGDPSVSLVLKEPPHPFSSALFAVDDSSRPWRSAATVWAEAARRIATNDIDDTTFGDEPLSDSDAPSVLTVETLTAVVTDPTRFFCSEVLGTALTDTDDASDIEAQAVRVRSDSGVSGHFRSLAWRLETAVQEHSFGSAADLGDWLRHQPEMPYGSEGARATEQLVDEWWPLLERFRSIRWQSPQALSLEVDGVTIVGRVDRLGDDARVIASLYDTSPSSALKHWVLHLLLNALADRGESLPRVTRFEGPSPWELGPVRRAEDLLARLVQLVGDARVQPLPLFRGAGIAWLLSSKGEPPVGLDFKQAQRALNAARGKWEGNSFQQVPGERERPWHRLCWPTTRNDELGPMTDDAFALAHEIYAPLLALRRELRR